MPRFNEAAAVRPRKLTFDRHLMFYVVEVLKGSPASERAVEFGQRVGIALLLVLMAFAFYNDLTRLFAG
jgi:regulator of sigma E protease